MSIATFDTLKTAKDLAGAGFRVDQAEAIATAMRDAVSESAVTKADMARQENRLERLDERLDERLEGMDEGGGCLARVEARLEGMATKADLAQVEARLEGMATKEDLARVEERLEGTATKADLARVEARLEGTATRADLYRGLLFQAGAIVAALAALNLLQ